MRKSVTNNPFGTEGVGEAVGVKVRVGDGLVVGITTVAVAWSGVPRVAAMVIVGGGKVGVGGTRVGVIVGVAVGVAGIFVGGMSVGNENGTCVAGTGVGDGAQAPMTPAKTTSTTPQKRILFIIGPLWYSDSTLSQDKLTRQACPLFSKETNPHQATRRATTCLSLAVMG